MIIMVQILTFVWLSFQSEEFENARILGFPRLSCSKQNLLFNFDTNIPFQGRISVVEKIHDPSCVQDYSANIERNATFKASLRHCMTVAYMNNGSREFFAHLEIGFHPLVITINDRLFSVKCVDNSSTIANLSTKTKNYNCTHSVRLASRWESNTVFHVGDAVVHEWTCDFHKDQKYQTFLTSCSAISSSSQIIHLVDENGCIVDSELFGEIIYNNFLPKVFARARMFKLINSDKYRIECNIEICGTKSVCRNRILPPKCAFTKEEIVRRYSTKTKIDSFQDRILTGIINHRHERQIRVTSEWITVRGNQYTNIEQLNERFFLSTVMDDKKEEEYDQNLYNHFLMGLSLRRSNQTEHKRNVHGQKTTATFFRSTTSTHSPLDSIIDFGKDNVTETTALSNVLISPSARMNASRKVLTRFPKSEPAVELNRTEIFSTVTIRKATLSRTSTTATTKESTTSKIIPSYADNTSFSEPSTEIVETSSTTYSSFPSTKLAKTPQSPLQMVSSGSIIEKEIAHLNVNVVKSIEESTNPLPKTHEAINTREVVELTNPRDWRLDDRMINETDLLQEGQLSKQICSWSSIEFFLVLWSFSSLIVWIAMIIICFCRQFSKPTWMKFREREQEHVVVQSRILQHEHPWIHTDAFEETQSKTKNELTIHETL